MIAANEPCIENESKSSQSKKIKWVYKAVKEGTLDILKRLISQNNYGPNTMNQCLVHAVIFQHEHIIKFLCHQRFSPAGGRKAYRIVRQYQYIPAVTLIAHLFHRLPNINAIRSDMINENMLYPQSPKASSRVQKTVSSIKDNHTSKC